MALSLKPPEKLSQMMFIRAKMPEKRGRNDGLGGQNKRLFSPFFLLFFAL
jgi:hypothetical protein